MVMKRSAWLPVVLLSIVLVPAAAGEKPTWRSPRCGLDSGDVACCVMKHLGYMADCHREFGDDRQVEMPCLKAMNLTLRACGRTIGNVEGDWFWHVFPAVEVLPGSPDFMLRKEFSCTIPRGKGGDYELVLFTGIPALDDTGKPLSAEPPAARGTRGRVLVDGKAVADASDLGRSVVVTVPVHLEPGKHVFAFEMEPLPRASADGFGVLTAVLHPAGK